MYKSFYKLRLNPFEITPDPSFMFPTTRHNEALAALYYGVTSRKGMVVLTGEVGTGKTLLLRAVLQFLGRCDVEFAFVFNPSLSPLEFMRYIAGDFRLPFEDKSKDQLIQSLNTFLLARHKKNQTTLLVVDEAHHLSAEVLEEVRLLTNLETSQQKLLQIILGGQPELDEMLDSHELRQIKQRIALRCHLDPLSFEETEKYIERRLQVAGAPAKAEMFSAAAVSRVFRHSQGIPRLINTVCENALLSGYAKRAKTITPEIVDEVAADMRLGVVSDGSKKNSAAKEHDLNDLLRAMRTLLELHERTQEENPKEPSLLQRLSEHEPYI